MSQIDLATIDLNLLVVLDVLLEERSVSRAARRLHRTQSAMSHALARLRNQLDDPLFVRVGNRMQPTPRAERLAPALSSLLRSTARLLGQEPQFEPAASTRQFTLAAPDFVAAALPDLVFRMREQAPGTTIELLPISPAMFRDLVDGHADAVIGLPRNRSDGLSSCDLASLEWTVFCRRDHPARKRWGKRAWERYEHVRVRTLRGSEGPVDAAAQTEGLSRRIGPILPHFLLAPPLLARTDFLMTAPRAVFGDAARAYRLATLRCPLPLSPIRLVLYWKSVLERDPATSWFRQILIDWAGALD